MKIAMIAFIITGLTFLVLLGLEFLAYRDYLYDEPTHTMSQEQMEWVCREEGIPLDY